MFFFVFSDTVSRSGMFCAISNAIEQCNTESLIDVFQATKAVRICKPGAVSSLGSVYRQTATDIEINEIALDYTQIKY